MDSSQQWQLCYENGEWKHGLKKKTPVIEKITSYILYYVWVPTTRILPEQTCGYIRDLTIHKIGTQRGIVKWFSKWLSNIPRYAILQKVFK